MLALYNQPHLMEKT